MEGAHKDILSAIWADSNTQSGQAGASAAAAATLDRYTHCQLPATAGGMTTT